MAPDSAGDAYGGAAGDAGGGVTVLPGARFGDLQLVREIGRGAQGVVYEGRQLSMGRSVAVKILPRDITLGTEQVDRFHREAEAAGRLSHPNIVSVFGFEESGGHLLLMQEMVTGGNLTDKLDGITDIEGDTERACQRAAQLVRKLADALQHAHEAGVVHRDIKPDNVLLTSKGEPKITDFGLARVEDKLGLSQTGAIMGTPHYMSPEQVTANPKAIDARTDVYSLGSLLYRLVTGQVPFSAKTLQGIFNDILNREPRTPRSLRSGVPPDLEAVILKALEKQPEARYQSARAMGEDLARFVQGETTVARPVGTLVRSFRSFQRQATSTLVMLALLAPTAWIALEFLVLAPMARERDELHPLRLGVLALATALLAWPLSVVARRWVSRGRLAVLVAAWLAALLLGAGAALRITDQRLDRLQAIDRDALANELEQEALSSRPDVADLVHYQTEWGTRFGPDDALLMSRGYLKRERPGIAAQWVARIDPALTGSPVHDALMLAVYDALGEEAPADEARVRLASGRDGASWVDWKLAGDVLRDMRLAREARDAYLRAGRQPDAPRDELNLELARVSGDLCAWDDLGEYLEDYRKWFPDDPRGQLVLHDAAVHMRDWDGALVALDAYTAHPSVAPRRRVELEHTLLRQQGREDEAWQLVLDTVERHGDVASILGWCGSQAVERARVAQRELPTVAARGDQARLERLLEIMRDALDRADGLYQRLVDDGLEPFTGEMGLAAVAMMRADLEPDRKLALLGIALSHAKRALELDDSYWQAHYNVAHAVLGQGRAEHGGFAEVPLDTLREYIDHMRNAIELNGLDHQLLNNAAYVLGRYLHDRTDDPADLDEALRLARRAVRASDPRRAGNDCPQTDVARQAHSNAYDTLRTLQELAGDLEGALESATGARDALLPGDPRGPARQANVQRLREALSGG